MVRKNAGDIYSYLRNTCWQEKSQLSIPFPWYVPTKSCPEEEQGTWMLALGTEPPKYYPHYSTEGGGPPPEHHNFPYGLRDGAYKKVQNINGIEFTLYQQSKENDPKGFYWYAVFKDKKGEDWTLQYVDHNSKSYTRAENEHKVPTIFLDFITSIKMLKPKPKQ